MWEVILLQPLSAFDEADEAGAQFGHIGGGHGQTHAVWAVVLAPQPSQYQKGPARCPEKVPHRQPFLKTVITGWSAVIIAQPGVLRLAHLN